MVISHKLPKNKICVDLIDPYNYVGKREKNPNHYHNVKAVISEIAYQKVYITRSSGDHKLS